MEKENALVSDEHPAPPSLVQLVSIVTSNLDSSLQSVFNSLLQLHDGHINYSNYALHAYFKAMRDADLMIGESE